MPRKRASKERRERDKLVRSALRQAAHSVQHRRVRFRPGDTVSVAHANEAVHIEEAACPDPLSADSIERDDSLQIDGREFESE